MASSRTSQGKLPQWLRWAALVWLLVWIPVYWRTWGPENFLHLCDLAVILRLHRFVVGQRSADFEPGSWAARRQHRVGGGRRLRIVPRPPLDSRNGISLRSALSVVGPAALAVSHRSSAAPPLGARAHRIRPARLGAAIGDCVFCFRRFAIHAAGGKHKFCLHRSLHSSRLGPAGRPRCDQHTFHDFRRISSRSPDSPACFSPASSL